jgi:hypothetical protein
MEINEYNKGPRIGPIIAVVTIVVVAVAAVIVWPSVGKTVATYESLITNNAGLNHWTNVQGDAAIVDKAVSTFNSKDATMVTVSTPIYLYPEPITYKTRPCVAEYGGVMRKIGVLPAQYVQANNLYTYENNQLAGPKFGERYFLVTYVTPADPIPLSPAKTVANCVNDKGAVYSIWTSDFAHDGTVIKN